jgi:hypothetical protein
VNEANHKSSPNSSFTLHNYLVIVIFFLFSVKLQSTDILRQEDIENDSGRYVFWGILLKKSITGVDSRSLVMKEKNC